MPGPRLLGPCVGAWWPGVWYFSQYWASQAGGPGAWPCGNSQDEEGQMLGWMVMSLGMGMGMGMCMAWAPVQPQVQGVLGGGPEGREVAWRAIQHRPGRPRGGGWEAGRGRPGTSDGPGSTPRGSAGSLHREHFRNNV